MHTSFVNPGDVIGKNLTHKTLEKDILYRFNIVFWLSEDGLVRIGQAWGYRDYICSLWLRSFVLCLKQVRWVGGHNLVKESKGSESLLCHITWCELFQSLDHFCLGCLLLLHSLCLPSNGLDILLALQGPLTMSCEKTSQSNEKGFQLTWVGF